VLRVFVHLHDGLIHLFYARRLLLAGPRNFSDDLGDVLHRGSDVAERVAGCIHELAAFLHFGDAVVDQHLDFLGAVALRPARLRTSVATTAKPRP